LNSLKTSSRKRRPKKSTKRKPRKRRRRNASAPDSGTAPGEEEDIEEEDEPHLEAQAVSVHKILTRKLKAVTERDKIQEIIDRYNDTDVRRRAEEKKYIEKEVAPASIPSVKRADQKYFKGEAFEVMIFVQRASREIGLLRVFDVTEKSVVVHCILFYFRPGEIFALTTGQAWNLERGPVVFGLRLPRPDCRPSPH
jgi:hypothetical protein